MESSFRREEFDLGQIVHRLEVIICGYQQVIRRVHRQVQSKAICVCNASIHSQGSGMNGTIRSRRNDLCFTRHQAAENANLPRRSEALAQFPRYFTPLHSRNAKRCPPASTGTQDLLNTIRARPIV